MIYGNTVGGSGGSGIGKTFIIEDEAGNQLVGIVTDRPVTFDAGPNDIRLGKTAATQNGVTVGGKDIPPYYASAGWVLIPAGAELAIPFADDLYDFTRLQAIVCLWDGSVSSSVAAQAVIIDGKMYGVADTVPLSTITKDDENRKIKFGVSNDSAGMYLIRYFTYKEER